MKPEEIEGAIETLQKVGEVFSSLAESKEEACEAGRQLAISQSYLVEMYGQIIQGVALHDAALIAVKGETPIGS